MTNASDTAREPEPASSDATDSPVDTVAATRIRSAFARIPKRARLGLLVALAAVVLVAGWRWWSGRPPGDVTRRIRPEAGPITQLVFSPTGNTLAAGSSRGEVVFIERETWSSADVSAITTQPLTAMVTTQDGHLLVATLGERLLLWDWATRTSKVMPGVPQVPTALEIHPVLGELLVGLRTGAVWRLNPATGDARTEEPRHSAAVTCLVSGPRGEWLFSGGGDGSVKVTFPADSKREPIGHTEHLQPISAVARAPSGRFVATADWGGTIRVWSSTDWKVIRTMEAEGAISRLAATETAIYAGGWDGRIRIWNADTGAEARPILCGYPVHALAIDPKLEWLATGSAEGWIDLRPLPEK